MAGSESLSPSLAASRARTALTSDKGRTVVALHGEHDASTAAAVSELLARAISEQQTDLVVDLSDVAFMSVATAAVMVRANEFLARRSLSLVIRSPSACAERVLTLCGLAHLVDDSDVGACHVGACHVGTVGLASWVPVPATDRAASGPAGEAEITTITNLLHVDHRRR